MRLPKRFAKRAKLSPWRYQKMLESARARDLNESDIATIVADFLTDVLGYAKYEQITNEFAVRSRFCDLTVRSAHHPLPDRGQVDRHRSA